MTDKWRQNQEEKVICQRLAVQQHCQGCSENSTREAHDATPTSYFFTKYATSIAQPRRIPIIEELTRRIRDTILTRPKKTKCTVTCWTVSKLEKIGWSSCSYCPCYSQEVFKGSYLQLNRLSSRLNWLFRASCRLQTSSYIAQLCLILETKAQQTTLMNGNLKGELTAQGQLHQHKAHMSARTQCKLYFEVELLISVAFNTQSHTHT